MNRVQISGLLYFFISLFKIDQKFPAEVLKKFPNLQSCDLQFYDMEKEGKLQESLEELGDYCPFLRYLDLKYVNPKRFV